MAGLHDEHRRKVRERYIKSGEGSLTPERLLEIVLFTPNSRKDTYDISKRLLKRFGTIRSVLEANIYGSLSIVGVKKVKKNNENGDGLGCHRF